MYRFSKVSARRSNDRHNYAKYFRTALAVDRLRIAAGMLNVFMVLACKLTSKITGTQPSFAVKPWSTMYDAVLFENHGLPSRQRLSLN